MGLPLLEAEEGSELVALPCLVEWFCFLTLATREVVNEPGIGAEIIDLSIRPFLPKL